MTPDEWDNATTVRPRMGACPVCWSAPEFQVSVQVSHGRRAWRCTRCNASTTSDLPFDPRTAPEGREESYAALATLSLLVPIFANIDRDLIYRIVRPYFNAGWSARDIVYAMNYTPDGQSHYSQGNAWVRGEPRDQTLQRLLRRLRVWRWKDQDDDGSDIMSGPDTSMMTAMATMADRQKHNAESRRIAEQLQDESSRLARERGASTAAHRVAAVAAVQARLSRRAATEREQQQRAQEITQAREASAAWLSRLNDA